MLALPSYFWGGAGDGNRTHVASITKFERENLLFLAENPCTDTGQHLRIPTLGVRKTVTQQ